VIGGGTKLATNMAILAPKMLPTFLVIIVLNVTHYSNKILLMAKYWLQITGVPV